MSLLKLWFWLGFGLRARPIFEVPREGFSNDFLWSDFDYDVGWRDRLRILVSGKLNVAVVTRTDVSPTVVECRSVFSVRHPGYKKPTPAQ